MQTKRTNPRQKNLTNLQIREDQQRESKKNLMMNAKIIYKKMDGTPTRTPMERTTIGTIETILDNP